MNTKCNIAKQSRGAASSRSERIATTLRQHMADVARGERVCQLRDDRHETQQQVADAVGVSLRTVQSWEAGGKIKWENAVKLGAHLEVDPESITRREVSEDDVTPDPFEGRPAADRDQLLAIQQTLDEQDSVLEEMRQQIAALVSAQESRASGAK